jgi:hypothetical protein
LRIARTVPLAALLIAGCAAAGTDAARPVAQSPAGLVQDGPFRMRIASTHPSLDPDGKLDVIFDVVVERADGRTISKGEWFLVHTRIAEQPLLTTEAEAYQDDVYLGMPFGWSPKGSLALYELPADTRRIRRLVVDLTMMEILEGLSEEIELSEGESADRSVDATDCSFTVDDGTIVVSRADSDDAFEKHGIREHLRLDGFYNTWSRDVVHAWEISDAMGRPFVAGPGWGSGGWSQDTYHLDPRIEGPAIEPLIVRWRAPRRWRATMQRFVFEDLVVPEPEKEVEPPLEKEK